MKGYDLQDAISREVRKKGTAGSEVKILTEEGEVYEITSVEDEEQPDGTHTLWIKVELGDG